MILRCITTEEGCITVRTSCRLNDNVSVSGMSVERLIFLTCDYQQSLTFYIPDEMATVTNSRVNIQVSGTTVMNDFGSRCD